MNTIKKKRTIFSLLYYVLCPIIYAAFFYMSSLLLEASGKSDNLGSVMAVTYGVLYFMTPILIGVLMRFSLFRWYVDPVAAAETPLFLYIIMIINESRRSGSIKSAFLLVNDKLSDDGGMGYLFLIGLFVFGLIISFSLARKNGQSISYRLFHLTDKINSNDTDTENKGFT